MVAYESVAATSTPESTELITQLTSSIQLAQAEIEPINFDVISQHAFQKLDVNNILGADGNERLIRELSLISNNPHAASTAVQNMATQIAELNTAASNTVVNLSNLWGKIHPIEDGFVEIQIVFDDQVAIRNFENMAEQAAFWEKTLSITKKALRDGSGEHEIVSLFKINPTGVTLKTRLIYAGLILSVVESSLGITKDLLGFKEAENAIVELQIAPEKKEAYQASLKKDQDKALSTRIDEETEKIVQKSGLNIGSSAVQNESKSDTRKLLERVYNFITDGGSVTLVNNSEADKESINQSFYELVLKTKQLREDRVQLKNPPLPKVLLSSEEPEVENPVMVTPVEPATETIPARKRRGRPPKAVKTTTDQE